MSHKRAITEADVRAVLPAATLEVPVGSVITPAARDLAKKLGVAFVETHAAPPAEHPEPAAHKPAARKSAAKAPPAEPAPAAPAPAPEAAPKPRPTTIQPAVQAPNGRKVIALGADHGGFALKELLKTAIGQLGYDVLDLGTSSSDTVDYPDFAVAVARAVAGGKAWRGIMVDGAGIGSAMAANKIAGVRAALCYDITTAANAREHNDANMLTLGGMLIGQRLATDIVQTFLATDFGGGRHQKRVDKINLLDR